MTTGGEGEKPNLGAVVRTPFSAGKGGADGGKIWMLAALIGLSGCASTPTPAASKPSPPEVAAASAPRPSEPVPAPKKPSRSDPDEGDGYHVTGQGVSAYLNREGLLRVGEHTVHIGPTDTEGLFEGHWRRGNRSEWGETPLVFQIVEFDRDLQAVYIRELTGEPATMIVFEHTVVLIRPEGLAVVLSLPTVVAQGALMTFPGDGTLYHPKTYYGRGPVRMRLSDDGKTMVEFGQSTAP